MLRQQQADLQYQQQLTSVIQTRIFRDLRFQVNNYFEYNRRGLVPEYQILGQKPWDDALRDPTKAIVPYDRQAPPADWNTIYNDPFGKDIEDIRAEQAANMAPYEPPDPGFIRPKHADGGRQYDKFL